MAKSERLTRAVALIDDSALRTRTLTFYRNGARGHLHGLQHCWKADYSASPVRMPVDELDGKQVHNDCILEAFDASAGSMQRATELVTVLDRLAAFRVTLDKSPTPAAIGQVLLGLAEATTIIEKAQRDEVLYASATKLLGEARDLKERADAFLSNAGERVTSIAAAELVGVTDVNRTQSHYGTHVPFAKPDEHARAGRLVGEQRRAALPFLWETWRTLRPDGFTAALHGVRDTCQTRTALQELSQLAGVELTAATPRPAAEVAREAWRSQVDADLTRLTRAWEDAYMTNLTQVEPVTLGCSPRRYYRMDDSVRAALQAFPHAINEHCTFGTYPSIVAQWLAYHLGDAGIELVDVVLDAEQLRVAVTLWSPDDEHSAYATAQSAARAALAL